MTRVSQRMHRACFPSVTRGKHGHRILDRNAARRSPVGSIVPRTVDREELQRLLDRGAQLVEVLPADEYDDEHLPGAINIPLRRVEVAAKELLDPSRPVIVYCWDDP